MINFWSNVLSPINNYNKDLKYTTTLNLTTLNAKQQNTSVNHILRNIFCVLLKQNKIAGNYG